MKKRVVSLLLALTLCVLPALADKGQKTEILTYQDIQVVVNGESIPAQDLEPFILNGRVYIPVEIDPNTAWDERANTVFIQGPTKVAAPEEDVFALMGKKLSGYYKRFALIKDDGSLWTWGEKYLGNGQSSGGNAPVHVMDGVSAVWMGDVSSLALKEDGSLWAWGSNYGYTLGNGQKGGEALAPVHILDHVATSSVGYYTAAAVTEDGGLYIWGWNADGNLGENIPAFKGPGEFLSPVHVMEDVADVSCNNGNYGAYTMVLKQDGSLWTFGNDQFGQLGDGRTDLGQQYWKLEDGGTLGRYPYEFAPQKILDNVVSIYAGDRLGAAIQSDGSLYTWGCNLDGRLGNGGAYNATSADGAPCQTVPLKIADNVAAVREGYATHLVFLKKDGTVWECGANYGDIPVQIDLRDAVAIAAGQGETYALKADGTLWSWNVWIESEPAPVPDIAR